MRYERSTVFVGARANTQGYMNNTDTLRAQQDKKDGVWPL
jgi:hypothetical protein